MTMPRPEAPPISVAATRPPTAGRRRRVDTPGAGYLPADPWMRKGLRRMRDRRRLRSIAVRAERITMRDHLVFLQARFLNG